jgi:hypothetical protein
MFHLASLSIAAKTSDQPELIGPVGMLVHGGPFLNEMMAPRCDDLFARTFQKRWKLR